ncbi:hypothetical protein SAMN05216256_10170 [Halopseudomonas pachastrellae]|uniref:hypothetical protein n=1 Tax=Halopseudomonas pachastrellae TaxID=254161 RepID=UPI0008DF3BAE|nr:hypothetical protein [Halopseudomonas pachastrellae]SFL70583.1 hypothetical protein SAMN05216256_10170 [Halopseudomonas pachastrellae]
MSDIEKKVLHWIATGRVGSSSKAMALAACEVQSAKSYPLDPGDLNRCLLMLQQVPEVRHHFDKIAALSEVWGRLIDRWGEIEATFLEEAGLDWSKQRRAPDTYRLMKEVIGNDPNVIQLGPGAQIRFQ